MTLDRDAVSWGPDGLVPAIVQDESDGRVLMLAWMDAEALSATQETGEVHFHSRVRDRLWRKGETSGNVLRLRSIALDCDGDALLVTVSPVGPTCHRGTRSCFDPEGAPAEAPDPGLRVARGAVVDDRRASRRAARGLVHRAAPRRRRRCGRPQGRRGGNRGRHGGEGRRGGRGWLARTDHRRGRRSPARSPTSCTTRSSCSPSAGFRGATWSRRCAPGTGLRR